MLVEGATAKISTLSCGECSKEFKAKVLFCPFCGKKNNHESAAFHIISGGLGGGDTAPASVHVLVPKDQRKVVSAKSETVPPDAIRSLGGPFSEFNPAGDDVIVAAGVDTSAIPSSTSHLEQAHQAEGALHAGAGDTDAGPKGRKPKIWRWVILLGVTALIAFEALRSGPSSDAPAEVSNPVSSTQLTNNSDKNTSKDRAAKPQLLVEDRVSSVRLSSQWQRVDIATDPARPMISLSSQQPFRIRVNGELYFIAARTPRLIRFGGASFMELKALKGNPDVKIIRSAMKEGG